MKPLVMALTFVLVGAGTPALAQPYGGRITLYSDIDFTETTSSDSGPGILTVYAVHEDGPDAVTWWDKAALPGRGWAKQYMSVVISRIPERAFIWFT